MKMILSLLDSTQIDVVNAALHLISRIIRSEKMEQSWTGFLELIVLKIIDCYKLKKVKTEVNINIFQMVCIACMLLFIDFKWWIFCFYVI